MSYPYTYTVLRYIHDTISGEFVNVGVALLCPHARFLQIHCKTTYKRISQIFPGFDGDSFRQVLRYIQRQFDDVGTQYVGDLPRLTKNPKSILEVAYSVFPKDDSSLQWSEAGSGMTNNPAATLDELFQRMVTMYDNQPMRTPMQDSDVFRRKFKRSLDRAGVSRHLKPRTVSVKHDAKSFDYALKNGRWHYLEPISFDLTSSEGIKKKAHEFLGEITSVADALKDAIVYFLIGEPSDHSLRPASDDAKAILERAAIDLKIICEENAEELSSELSKQVEEHK